MRARCRYIVLLVLVSMAAPGHLSGDDLFPPTWRGEPWATFQHWTFDDADNPALPEITDNPYGYASADIDVMPYGAGWMSMRPQRSGVWADLSSVSIEIPDMPRTDGTKLVLIQLTYVLDILVAPEIDVPGGSFVGGTTLQLESYATSTWYLRQELWEVSPSTSNIQVDAAPVSAQGFATDQIVVDTLWIGPPNIVDIRRDVSGNPVVEWESTSACTYRIESATGPGGYEGSSTTWVTEASGIPGQSGITEWTDTAPPSDGFRFYRVVRED